LPEPISCCFLPLLPPLLRLPLEISIGVSLDFASDIVQAMDHHPDACAQDDFFSADWHRTVLEFFIVCRAVRIGGIIHSKIIPILAVPLWR